MPALFLSSPIGPRSSERGPFAFPLRGVTRRSPGPDSCRFLISVRDLGPCSQLRFLLFSYSKQDFGYLGICLEAGSCLRSVGQITRIFAYWGSFPVSVPFVWSYLAYLGQIPGVKKRQSAYLGQVSRSPPCSLRPGPASFQRPRFRSPFQPAPDRPKATSPAPLKR